MTNGNGNGHGPEQEHDHSQLTTAEFIDYAGEMVDSADHRSFLAATYWINLYAEVMGGAGVGHGTRDRTSDDVELLSAAEERLFEELVISVYDPGGPRPEETEPQVIQLLGEIILKRRYLAAITGSGSQ